MENQEKELCREPCGVLVIDKHEGVSSHDIVNRVRRAFGTRRVGHTGTLDPMATGVLVVLVGRAAKAAEYLCADTKCYTAGLRLGITTDSQDITGEIISQEQDIPSFGLVKETCKRFVGNIFQTPPMYSALKIGGQKLVDLARKGQTVARDPRPITVHQLLCRPTEDTREYILEVKCSSGTYIRTLCADIGTALGCGGVMSSLRRTEAGGFSLSKSISIPRLESMTMEARLGLLAPVESLFASLPAVSMPAFYERLSRSGCEIYQAKLKTDHAVGQRLRVCDAAGHFYALGEVREYPEGTALKIIKLFEL